MRKTNTNIKRLKFVKGIAAFLAIQLVVIGVFLFAHRSNQPEDENRLKNAVITIEDIEYQVYYPLSDDRVLNVFSDSEVYMFSVPIHPLQNEYSVYELYKTLKIGDELSLIYVENDGLLLGEVNYILDAKIGTTQLRSIEARNQKLAAQRRLGITYLVIIELVWCALLGFYCAFNRDILVRKKRKTGDGSVS